ncbi:YOR390W-like protein [Saccharomyces cerevisiae x Saccharomyces kudriavzevii VIN7]|uniref:YOR390W-like protein n=1 Tax=Saccharomyces cerevisiae x Saccharomyces kudriavzevii (strain VIN7) TaxID=1095631 RepID=H0GZT3_SACCK|nr:YOR390W-like protein [Saccharomyces cerevisiae x Saccharomyces kudriavzevii VIN7]
MVTPSGRRKVFLDEVILHLSFISHSILGNYCRLGLIALSNYPNAYIRPTTALWANVVACIIMGIVSGLNIVGWFENHGHLYACLTVGLAGSTSSFSTMMIEVFDHSMQLTPNTAGKFPNKAYGITEFLSVLLTHLLMSMSALVFGRKIAQDLLAKYFRKPLKTENEEISSLEFKREVAVDKIFKVDIYASALLCIPIIATLITLACVYSNYSRGDWTLPALFGIFGSYLRWILSKKLNPKIKYFPLGTFIANIFATLVLAILNIVQRGNSGSHNHHPIIESYNTCLVISALGSGFCGGLGTTSTFINEAYSMPFLCTMFYYITSVALSYSLIVITLGSYAWTKGLTGGVC